MGSSRVQGANRAHRREEASMPIVYTCAGRVGEPVNIAQFVQDARRNPIGPQPGKLEEGLPATKLNEGMANLQLQGTAKSKTVTTPLFTCAAVLYYSADPSSMPGVWCHHAPSGVLTDHDILTAIARLGNPAGDTIRVVYAHDRPGDAKYDTQMAKLLNRGILPDSFIEIPSLPMPVLGVDYQGMLGY
jgi:hypothetical protein